MFFPIKLNIHPNNRCLFVTENHSLKSEVKVRSVLIDLKKKLYLITQAAQLRLALSNSSSSFSTYLASSQDPSIVSQESSQVWPIMQWEWHVIRKESGIVKMTKGSLPVMLKLVHFLKEKGCTKFPQLFNDQASLGSQIVDSTIKLLEKLLVEAPMAEPQLPSLVIIAISRKRPASFPEEAFLSKKIVLTPQFSMSEAFQKQSVASTSSSISENLPVPLVSDAFELLSDMQVENDSEDDEALILTKRADQEAAEALILLSQSGFDFQNEKKN